MSTCPAFASPLAPVITRYLDLMTALGRGYATERRVFYLLDAFLVAEHASELTPEVFERWCRTQAHLKSGIQRTQMRMVRMVWCCSTLPVCAGVSCCASPCAITIRRPTPSLSERRSSTNRVCSHCLQMRWRNWPRISRCAGRLVRTPSPMRPRSSGKVARPCMAIAGRGLAGCSARWRARRASTRSTGNHRGCMMSATVLPSTPWCAGTALALTSTPNCPSYRRIWGTCPLPLPSTTCALSNRWHAPPVSASRSITATY